MTDRDKLTLLIAAGDTLRLAQKTYFRTRLQTDLDAAREAEKRFDRALAEAKRKDGDGQGRMFT